MKNIHPRKKIKFRRGWEGIPAGTTGVFTSKTKYGNEVFWVIDLDDKVSSIEITEGMARELFLIWDV